MSTALPNHSRKFTTTSHTQREPTRTTHSERPRQETHSERPRQATTPIHNTKLQQQATPNCSTKHPKSYQKKGTRTAAKSQSRPCRAAPPGASRDRCVGWQQQARMHLGAGGWWTPSTALAAQLTSSASALARMALAHAP